MRRTRLGRGGTDLRTTTLFLLLVVGQTLHSLEEYIFRLWESFPPAQFLTGLVSSNLATGFVVINVSLVLFGWWCFFWPVSNNWRAAVPIAWGWAAIEIVNGVGHPAWGIATRRYTPGLITAVLMLPVAFLLIRRLIAGDGTAFPEPSSANPSINPRGTIS